MDEIPAKRLKPNELSSELSSNIVAILSDEHTKPIEWEQVAVGQIVDVKSTAKIVAELSNRVPLIALTHLKRVNRTSQIILTTIKDIEKFMNSATAESGEFKLCVERELTENASTTFVSDVRNSWKENAEILAAIVKEILLARQVSSGIVEMLSKNIKIVEVPCNAPILRWQFNESNLKWPCKFHPVKYLEQLFTGEIFSTLEKGFHLRMLEICNYLCSELNESSAGIVVDPRSNRIVAVAFDRTQKHPLMHCPMSLIDAVARTQNGGAWTRFFTDDDKRFDNSSYTLHGTSENVRDLINSRFDGVKFGADEIRNYSKDFDLATIDPFADNLAKYGPYLCTGYTVYLTDEPCTMCSMALTHSRIKRLFFARRMKCGAVASVAKLHTVKALNHHFEVFCVEQSSGKIN